MASKRFFLALCMGCLLQMSFGQTTDSTDVQEAPKAPKVPLRLFSFADPHIPKKATIYSAVIPGLGQAYNRKYWKVPVVYATIGTATWFMLEQRKTVRTLNAEFRALYADSSSPTVYQIADRNQARRLRDLGIIAVSALYVLQIVDATVDAHFYKLDIDQNLEARLNPSPGYFLSFRYTF
jgi:23S rRNA A2030 N6-methylase RlmJ